MQLGSSIMGIGKHCATAWVLLLLPLSFFLTPAPPSSAADDLIIEGEEFTAYGSNNIGGLDILPEFCSGASGYYAADGLDVPGEWIKLKVTFPFEGCYSAVLAYQAEYGDVVKLAVKMLDTPSPGQILTTSFMLDQGYGFG
jgi:hypothetical protein